MNHSSLCTRHRLERVYLARHPRLLTTIINHVTLLLCSQSTSRRIFLLTYLLTTAMFTVNINHLHRVHDPTASTAEPRHVTHRSTNRARRRVTSLIRPTPLPLRHAIECVHLHLYSKKTFKINCTVFQWAKVLPIN